MRRGPGAAEFTGGRNGLVGGPGSRLASRLEGASPSFVCPSGMGETVGR